MDLDEYELRVLIRKLVSSHKEGEWWDFKREWPSKEDLLYDLICLSNNSQFRDAFIIIGVDEEHEHSFCDIREDPNRKNTQKITDFLKGQPFAGDYYPDVKVQELVVDKDITIDIVIISSSKNAPYFLSKTKYGIHAGSIATRTMDTNTPRDESASYRQIELLWQNHFGLLDSPIERLQSFLSDNDGWQDSLEHSEGEKEFYIKYPEYTIEHMSDDRLDGYEYYNFAQTDQEPHWYEIFARYHQTVIWGIQGTALDGGRYFTSVPDRSFIGTPSHSGLSVESLKYSYCYYIADSINYLMHKHFIRNISDDERIARDRFLRSIIIYNNEAERRHIEQKIQSDTSAFEEAMSKITPYVYIPEEHTEISRKSYYESFQVVRYIQNELEVLRKEKYPYKLHIKEDPKTSNSNDFDFGTKNGASIGSASDA